MAESAVRGVNSCRTCAQRTSRIKVGLCDGLLLLFAQRARQDDRVRELERVREKV